MGLRVTGVHYQQLTQCCLGLMGQTDPNILDEETALRGMELT